MKMAKRLEPFTGKELCSPHDDQPTGVAGVGMGIIVALAGLILFALALLSAYEDEYGEAIGNKMTYAPPPGDSPRAAFAPSY